MIQNFKSLTKLKHALSQMGYFIGNPAKNGEFYLIKKIIKHFNIFVDVGFHKGEISKFVRNYQRNIIIYGFDYNLNFKKKKLSYFKKRKINFLNIGLYNKAKTINTFNYKYRPELSSLKPRKDYNPYMLKKEKITKKKVIPLDFFFKKKKLNKKNKIFIKIDTDGSEKKILLGMKKILDNFDVSGYFEYGSGWKNCHSYLKDVFYYLKKKNYQIYRITNKGLILMRYFSELDENYFQSHYFFSKKILLNLNLKQTI